MQKGLESVAKPCSKNRSADIGFSWSRSICIKASTVIIANTNKAIPNKGMYEKVTWQVEILVITRTGRWNRRPMSTCSRSR